MIRENLIKAVEKETQDKVKRITWIYGIGENVGDSGDPLYHYDVTLQIELNSGIYISVTATNYCTDRRRVIESTIGSYELSNVYSDLYLEDDDLFDKMLDYIETYGDKVERPSRDSIFFEPM